MSLFSGASQFTGVDMGASAVKMLGGKLQRKTFAIDQMSIVPVAARAMDERGIVNKESVGQSLHAAIEAFGKKPSRVASAMGGLGVLTKRITIPKIPKKEIPDQVRWEAEQVFPTDIASIVTDYVLLGEGGQVPGAPAGTKGWDLLLVGVRTEEVSALRDVITESKLPLKVLDLNAFVVSDFLEKVIAPQKKEVIAYVDIGATTTRVTVRGKGHVIYIREFVTAGNAFTDAIAQRLGLSFEDAEALKIQDGSAIPQEALEALRGQIAVWKTDLQQSEDIFVAQEHEVLIDKWCFFGGASLTPGLMDALHDERFGPKLLALPYADMFSVRNKKLDASILSAWAPRLVTAAALAAREA